MPLTRSLILAGAALLMSASHGLPQTAPDVDQSGLRYFALAGDQVRFAAEMARLKAIYPGWTPPVDPLSTEPPPDTELEAIWSLVGSGKAPEARAAVATLQGKRPGWQPPAELTARLVVIESRARLINASDLKQSETVVSVAAETPTLLNCDDIDVLWRLADAFASTERPDRATDVYAYILDTCTSPPERLASMQKASQILDRGLLEPLLERERTDADGNTEFVALRLDLARENVAAAGADSGTPATREDIARLNAGFDAAPGGADALLLGWASYRQGHQREAERWFRRAAELDDTADAALGLALVQISQGAYDAAEATIDPWRDASEEAEAVYLAAAANLLAGDPPRVLDEAILVRIVSAVMNAQDVRVAQQLGWYARAFGQTKVSADWFATALDWDPANEPVAFGLALSRHDLGDSTGLAALQATWGARSPRIADINAAPSQPAPTPPPVSPAEPRRTAAAPSSSAASPARGGCGGAGAGGALAMGWCLMEANRPLEAARAFARAGTSGSATVRSDAAYGESLAYLREGLSDRAAVAALKAPLSRQRQVELQASILADQAVTAFRQGRYTDALVALDQRSTFAGHRIDLLVLSGHAYLKLGRKREARQVFAAAAQTGDASAREGLALVDQQMTGR